MPVVSVIIPTFNHQEFVLQCLDSVFRQTFADYEVVVVNDGSPDRTHEFLQPLHEAGKIRYVQQQNQGAASARNRGLKEAAGEFIAFLDDDDQWPHDKLEWQIDVLRRDTSLAVVAGSHQYAPWVDIGSGALDSGVELTFESFFARNPIVSPGQTLIRATSLRKAGGFNSAVWGADDYDLWFRLSLISKIKIYARPALVYRVHGSNAGSNAPRMFLSSLKVIELNLARATRGRRKQLRDQAYRLLFKYYAAILVDRAKGRLRHFDMIGAWRSARLLANLWPTLLGDHEMLQRLLFLCLPRRARQ